MAFTEILRPGVIYEYRFATSEMKDPVLDAIVERGWKVEGSLRKAAVTR